VDRVASSGLATGAVARELGLRETLLRRWMAQFSTVQVTDAVAPQYAGGGPVAV